MCSLASETSACGSIGYRLQVQENVNLELRFLLSVLGLVVCGSSGGIVYRYI